MSYFWRFGFYTNPVYSIYHSPGKILYKYASSSLYSFLHTTNIVKNHFLNLINLAKSPICIPKDHYQHLSSSQSLMELWNTREMPAFGGISLALQGSGADGAHLPPPLAAVKDRKKKYVYFWIKYAHKQLRILWGWNCFLFNFDSFICK